MRPAHRTWSTLSRAISLALCPALVELTVAPYLAGCAGSGDEGEADVGELTEPVGVDPTRNAIGRVTSTGSGLARTFFEYDPLGRIAADERVLDGVSYVSRRAFGYSQGSVAGPGNAPMTERLPDGEVARFAYGAGGVETSRYTTAPGGSEETVVTGIKRNARGQTTEVTTGDGWVTAYCYNESTDLRLSQIKTGLWGAGANRCTTAATSILQAYQYAFDAASNVTEVRDYCDIGRCCDPAVASCLAGPLSGTFTYDARNRLTSIATDTDGNGANETYSYAYDAIGNLTSKRGKAQTYGARGKSHALASSGSVTFSYDANGNLVTGSDGTRVDWNAHNMATRIVRRGVTTENSFVGTERWKKVQSGVTTYYLGAVVVEGGLHRKYFGQQAERDPHDTSCGIAAGCLKYYHNDHLGSSTLVTDDEGAVVRRAVYWPYGEKRATQGAFDPRYEFTFQEEEETGLYNYGARYYNPETGRFLSADPIAIDPADPRALNRYAYAQNNPLAYVDPTGHSPIAALIWGLVAMAASTAISMIPIKELRIMLSIGMGLITGAGWLGDKWGQHLLGRVVQASINAAGQVSPKAGRILGIATGLIGVLTYHPNFTTPTTFFTAPQNPQNPNQDTRPPDADLYDILMQKEMKRRAEMEDAAGWLSGTLLDLLPASILLKLGLTKRQRRDLHLDEPSTTEFGIEAAGVVLPEIGALRKIGWAGSKALRHLRNHAQHARSAAVRMGWLRPNTLDDIKTFLEAVVHQGELRVGTWGDLDVLMSKLGDTMVIRRMDGSYITNLDLALEKGNGLVRWNEAVPVHWGAP